MITSTGDKEILLNTKDAPNQNNNYLMQRKLVYKANKPGFFIPQMPRVEVINDKSAIYKESGATYPFIFGPPNL